MASIEQIYDKLVAEEKMKKGSKYERLASIVFKTLDEDDTVVHDLRLRGDGKSAQHQIDVTINKNGSQKRILVECKEYDKVIGIGIIRDFYGAVSQIKPDDAIVITTKGYTKGAVNFARDENIKLGILREARDEDWDGLIRKIEIKGVVSYMNTPIISWVLYDEEELNRAQIILKDFLGTTTSVNTRDEFFYNEDLIPISNYKDIIEPIVSSAPLAQDQVTKGRHLFNEKWYVNMVGHFFAIKGFDYEFSSSVNEFNSIVDDGGKIASLLYKIIDSDDKVLLFENEIEKWTFDDDGEVTNKVD